MLLLAASVPSFLHVIDPPARDQGVFALIAWRWSAGDVPYKSAGLEQKGPLPFLGYRMGFQLFGNAMQSARLMAALLILVSGFLVAVLAGGRLTRPAPDGAADAAGGGGPPPDRLNPIGACAGALYLIIVGGGGLSTYWSGAQAESFMEPFTLLALLCFVLAMEAAAPATRDASRNGAAWAVPRRFLVLAGVSLGTASLGKVTALLLLPALVFAWPGPRLPFLGPLLVGVALPWVLTSYYFMVRGAFGEFVDAVFLLNVSYGRRGLLLLPGRLTAFLQSHHIMVNAWFLVPAAAGVLFLWPARRRPEVRLLFGWALAAYAQVLIQGRMFGYHYHPVVAPVTLLAVAGFAAAFGRARAGSRRFAGLALGLSAAVVLAVAGMPWIETQMSFRRLTGRISEARFLQHFSPGGRNSDVDPVDTYNAARFAERTLGPDETLLVWGFEPAVNYLSRRRNPTRFIYDYYLTSPALPLPQRQRNWRLFWEDLHASPPDWIAVVHNDRNPVESVDSAAQIRDVPALADYLDEHYQPEVMVGDFEFYRRRAGP